MNIVICTDGKDCFLTTGKEYEVINVNDKYNFIRVVNDLGNIFDYDLYRFKEKNK